MLQSIPAEFHGTPLTIIEHASRKWLTAEDAGLCLGYSSANASQGVRNLYNRHNDEFSTDDTCQIKMIWQGQNREMRMFSETGCIKLGFFSNTTRAKEFRNWASQTLAGKTVEAKPRAPMPPLQNSIKINRKLEREVFEMFAAGWRARDIGKELKIGESTVNRLLHANYRFSPFAGVPEVTEELSIAVAERFYALEQHRIAMNNERIAQSYLANSHNVAHAKTLEQVGQRLLTPAITKAEQHLAWAIEDEANGNHEAASLNRAAAAALGGDV